MEASRAVSSGVDRTIKVWDLGRGFCKNGFLCAANAYPPAYGPSICCDTEATTCEAVLAAMEHSHDSCFCPNCKLHTACMLLRDGTSNWTSRKAT